MATNDYQPLAEDKRPFPFNDLPKELRLEVLKHALPRIVVMSAPARENSADHLVYSNPDLPLLLASRKFKQEVEEVITVENRVVRVHIYLRRIGNYPLDDVNNVRLALKPTARAQFIAISPRQSVRHLLAPYETIAILSTSPFRGLHIETRSFTFGDNMYNSYTVRLRGVSTGKLGLQAYIFPRNTLNTRKLELEKGSLLYSSE
jgi:hypothetical protein